jgi:hypothetical protein
MTLAEDARQGGDAFDRGTVSNLIMESLPARTVDASAFSNIEDGGISRSNQLNRQVLTNATVAHHLIHRQAKLLRQVVRTQPLRPRKHPLLCVAHA